MKREDYIQLRNENRLQEIAFIQYRERGGTLEFADCVKSGALSNVNMDLLLNELDVKFHVTLILNQEVLIKVQ